MSITVSVSANSQLPQRNICVFLFQISFLISMTVNYNRIKVSRELTEYRNAVELQDADSTVMANSRFKDSSQYSTSAY